MHGYAEVEAGRQEADNGLANPFIWLFYIRRAFTEICSRLALDSIQEHKILAGNCFLGNHADGCQSVCPSRPHFSSFLPSPPLSRSKQVMLSLLLLSSIHIVRLASLPFQNCLASAAGRMDQRAKWIRTHTQADR